MLATEGEGVLGGKVGKVDTTQVVVTVEVDGAGAGAHGNEPYAPLPGRNKRGRICADNVVVLVVSVLGYVWP